jgi:hypothetical protein
MGTICGIGMVRMLLVYRRQISMTVEHACIYGRLYMYLQPAVYVQYLQPTSESYPYNCKRRMAHGAIHY